MYVNPDYQAEAHQLGPFSAPNTFSVCSSNRATHADKHKTYMTKAQETMRRYKHIQSILKITIKNMSDWIHF